MAAALVSEGHGCRHHQILRQQIADDRTSRRQRLDNGIIRLIGCAKLPGEKGHEKTARTRYGANDRLDLTGRGLACYLALVKSSEQLLRLGKRFLEGQLL